jgi:hypothetical protein
MVRERGDAPMKKVMLLLILVVVGLLVARQLLGQDQ